MRAARLFAAAALASGAAVAGAQAPGEVELELWRSATRIDTPAAYEAYLAAHPSGTFAPMARAALAKAGTATGPVRPVAQTGKLGTLWGAATSGSIDLPVGTRLAGPGVVTIGSVGAKRQLVLPAGEWMLLAAEDYRGPGMVQPQMASLAFGKFVGTQLRSLLVATFNRRAIVVPSGSAANLQAMGQLPRWTAAELCEAPVAGDQMRDVGGPPALRHCAALRPADDWRQALAGTPLTGPLDAALKTLEATAAPFAWKSELHFTDIRYGWISIMRFDSADVGSAPARASWLQRYLALARQGCARELDTDDLMPGALAAARPLTLPD